MFNLDGERAERFEEIVASDTATYADVVEALGPGYERGYFLYRFSDPSYVVAHAVIRAVAGVVLRGGGRAIDICGGSGHLTRALMDLSSPPPVLADLYFAKVWLGRHFTAPGCEAVCCHAEAPMPFRRGSLQVCDVRRRVHVHLDEASTRSGDASAHRRSERASGAWRRRHQPHAQSASVERVAGAGAAARRLSQSVRDRRASRVQRSGAVCGRGRRVGRSIWRGEIRPKRSRPIRRSRLSPLAISTSSSRIRSSRPRERQESSE